MYQAERHPEAHRVGQVRYYARSGQWELALFYACLITDIHQRLTLLDEVQQGHRCARQMEEMTHNVTISPH